MRRNRGVEQNRCYHLASRLAHRAFFLDDGEKDRAIVLMRRVEAGVQANMSYCINRAVSISSDPFDPQITWTFPSVSFSKDCDDTNPSWVVTLGGVSGDIGGTISIGMGLGIAVGYWLRYTLQVDIGFSNGYNIDGYLITPGDQFKHYIPGGGVINRGDLYELR